MGRSPFSRSSAARQPDNGFENEFDALSSTIMQAMSLIQGFGEGNKTFFSTTIIQSCFRIKASNILKIDGIDILRC